MGETRVEGGGAVGPAGGRAALGALALIVTVTAAAYAPAVGGDFHWDDDLAVLGKPTVIDAGRLGIAAFLPPSLGRERPLTDLTFAANRATTGWANAPFVATNVAIHLAAVVLAFLVAREILHRVRSPRAEAGALLVAGIFALHPLQTQAVSYVCQRAESLASLLYLAGVLAWLKAEELEPDGAWGCWLAGGWLAFLSAVAAKNMALTLPVVALVAVLMTGTRRAHAGRFWLAAAVGPVAASIAIAAGTLGGMGGAKDAGFDAQALLGPWRYLLTQAWVIAQYVRLLGWPGGLSIDHAVRVSPGLGDPVTILLVLAILASLAWALRVAWRCARGRPPSPERRLAALGVLWYVALLAPTSTVVPLADPMAEHRAYLANFGLLLALVAGGSRVADRIRRPESRRRLALGIAAFLALGLAGATAARNLVWRSDLALWREASEMAPRYFRPRLHLANALWKAGEREQALDHYRAAAALAKPMTEGWAMGQKALAHGLRSLGRHSEASDVLEAAIAAAPGVQGLWEAQAMGRFLAGDYPGTLRVVARARASGAGGAELAAAAGKAAASMGDLATALAELRSAVRLAPYSAVRRSDLAIVSWMAGLGPEACSEISRFVELEADLAMRADGARLRRQWGCAGR